MVRVFEMGCHPWGETEDYTVAAVGHLEDVPSVGEGKSTLVANTNFQRDL